MNKPSIALLGEAFPQTVCARLEADYALHRVATDAAAAFFSARGGGIDALIVAGDAQADAALMDALPNLKIVACYGVGYDGIDTRAAAARGAWVSNTPDVLNDDVADLALALMLAVTRQLPRVDRYVRDGLWRAQGGFALTDRLTGKRLGMLGMGRIGGAIVRRALAFDMTIAYHATAEKPGSPHRFAASPASLAAGCDILCVAAPATLQTRNIVDAPVLDALGKDGYLVNIARGALVDEPALIAALQSGAIKGAALDVFADEPNVPAALRAMDNVVLSAHQGSATTHTRLRMAELVADNIDAVLAGGAPVTPVNRPPGLES